MDTIKVICGIIYKNEKILLCRRKPKKSLGGFWEFPGGKVEGTESYENCLHRELKEELEMSVEIKSHFKNVFYKYEKFSIELISFICQYKASNFTMVDHDLYEWLDISELLNKKLSPADIPIAKAITKKTKFY